MSRSNSLENYWRVCGSVSNMASRSVEENRERDDGDVSIERKQDKRERERPLVALPVQTLITCDHISPREPHSLLVRGEPSLVLFNNEMQ